MSVPSRDSTFKCKHFFSQFSSHLLCRCCLFVCLFSELVNSSIHVVDDGKQSGPNPHHRGHHKARQQQQQQQQQQQRPTQAYYIPPGDDNLKDKKG